MEHSFSVTDISIFVEFESVMIMHQLSILSLTASDLKTRAEHSNDSCNYYYIERLRSNLTSLDRFSFFVMV